MRTAVAERDSKYDGRFYYGVLTTGVFCRPSCSSRQPLPENLRFFANIKSAVVAGFRPCKRCRPMESSPGLERVIEVARHIEAHADDRLTLGSLAKYSGLSPSRLQRSFKAAFGVSPKVYQDAQRLKKFKSALKGGDEITSAIFGAGFGSTSRVYGEAARNLGMTPKSYRSGGAGESIDYACRETVLGPMMMAATDRGVCFVQFGKDEVELLKQLRREFPRADLKPSSARQAGELDDWMKALDAHLNRKGPRPDLPVDLRGTAFQVKVWRFLLTLSEGEVISYGELADSVHQPKAARAAASACAKNRIAVLIPCHRVLRGDGNLGGYRWGIARKRALLDAERGG